MTGYDDKAFLAWKSTFVKSWGTLFLGVRRVFYKDIVFREIKADRT